jgi:hypothetical protein
MKQLYNLLIQKLKSLNKNIFFPDTEELNIKITNNFNISDYKFNTINTTITFKETDQVNKPIIYSYGFIFNVEKTENPKFMKVIGDNNTVNLLIETAIPEYETINISDFIKFLKKDKKEFINSITHEMSHSYEKYKKPLESIIHRNNYETYKEIRMNIKPIDNFSHMLYFISETENTVRPSEILADMKQKNITKEQFNKFIKNNTVYKKLLDAKNFSYEKLKSELLENINSINIFIEDHKDIFNTIPTTDIDKVNLILKTYFISSINIKMRKIQNMLNLDHPLAQFFLPDIEKRIDIHDKYGKKLTKTKNYNKFFEFEEKRINFVADKMIKKIHKLYDMAKDNNTTENNKEIKDWELYHKIKKTPTNNLTTEILNTKIITDNNIDNDINNDLNNNNNIQK